MLNIVYQHNIDCVEFALAKIGCLLKFVDLRFFWYTAQSTSMWMMLILNCKMHSDCFCLQNFHILDSKSRKYSNDGKLRSEWEFNFD